MKKGLIAVLLAVLAVTLVALPALAEELEYSPSGTPVTRMNLIGSGMNTTPPAGNEWVEFGASARAADGSIRLVVEGKVIKTDVKPFIDSSDRTQAPFRVIGEALGCVVDWSDADKKVTCTKEGLTVEMIIGNDTIWVNGKPQAIDTAPLIKEDRTFVPVRALGEALSCYVRWSEPSLTVIVSSTNF